MSAYFDDATNAVLLDLIKKCQQISGNSFMVENKVPPHVTFLQFQTRTDIRKVKTEFTGAGIPKKIIPVGFTDFGCEIPSVLYLSIKKDGALENLSNIFFERFSRLPETIFTKSYLPQKFYPHVTLAKTLTKTQRELLLDFLKSSPSPKNASIVSFSLTAGKPASELDRVELL